MDAVLPPAQPKNGNTEGQQPGAQILECKGSRESLGMGGEEGSAFEAFLNEENLELQNGRV